MDPITQQTTLAAAGGKKDPVYVDDVFSTTIYKGNETAGKVVTTGIDNTDKSLVWLKNRDGGYAHVLVDTERGVSGGTLSSNYNSAQGGEINHVQSLTSTGLTVNGSSTVNHTNDSHVAWNFKAAPGFFDIVTYTGNATLRTIPHSLGSVPGMIIIKEYSGAGGWTVYHRSIGNEKQLRLDITSGQAGTTAWNDTTPTSTHFTVNSDQDVNENGETFVAYIFAHDDASFGTDGDESIIKCGSYLGNSASQAIDVGFEPQFVMVKNISSSADWAIFDVMRNFHSRNTTTTTTPDQSYLKPNTANVETTNVRFNVSTTGFQTTEETQAVVNYSPNTYIYMAIRRPHKPPEVATDVFAIDTGNSSSTIPCFDSGFPVDFAFRRDNYASAGTNPRTHSRIQGPRELYPSQDLAEGSSSNAVWDSNEGYCKSEGSGSISWMFKRAPGFMDVVAYTGDNTDDKQITHNLGVAPELAIIKNITISKPWPVWSKYADYVSHEHVHGLLGNSNGTIDFGNYGAFNNQKDQSSLFTSSIFTVRTSSNYSNGSGYNYIAYLFASLPGISKVGRYDGTGNAINVDCGFTSGARFVMIKRMNYNGDDWYLWDTTRGYNGTSDNYLKINTTSGQDDNIANIDDHLDALAAGFTVQASSGVNTSGGKYLFLAIA